ncbi:MAG TPA: hypothetical protein VK668_22735 [Mucilaginibacter sp.]|nr:hypothetical protein [Mucilaginibacter sp.]
MSEELKSSVEAGYKANEKLQSALPLEESLKTLERVGGFDFLEAIIDGIDNLNPAKKARGKIFRTDSDKKGQRKLLKSKMQVWVDLLSDANSIAEMTEISSKKAETADKLLKNNLKKILDSTHDLEQSYRSVNLFYKNTESTKLKNVNIMNASIDQLTDLDEPRFMEHVGEEFEAQYDRLDLRRNYSLLVIPGYLKSNKVVDKWGKMAYKNKVMMVTDFENIETPDDVLDLFLEGNFTSAEPHKANVLMTCNYIVGRGKKDDVGEEEDMYVPGSSALAGKMYCTKLSQPVAGKAYGTIDEVDAVRFDQKKAEISALENAGLIPLVGEWGKVMPFSAKTLFNGDNLGMQTYSVVRVFDFVAKVVSDFLNRRALEIWDDKLEDTLRRQIVKFLDSVTGAGQLIEKFSIGRFEQGEDKNIYININMTPFFTAKSFLVKFDGYKGDDDKVGNWDGKVV